MLSWGGGWTIGSTVQGTCRLFYHAPELTSLDFLYSHVSCGEELLTMRIPRRMWTYPKVFPCPLAFIPLGRSGRPCNLCRGGDDKVKLHWRWWAEALHVVSLNRNTVSQCSESQEIKICAFPGEWLWICHALYWQLLVYSFPSFFLFSHPCSMCLW